MGHLRKFAWIIIGPAAALLIAEVAQRWLHPMLFSPFLATVFLTSRFLGFWSVVAATLVSAILVDFFMLRPILTFDFSRDTLLALAQFVAIALLTAGLASLSKHPD